MRNSIKHFAGIALLSLALACSKSTDSNLIEKARESLPIRPGYSEDLAKTRREEALRTMAKEVTRLIGVNYSLSLKCEGTISGYSYELIRPQSGVSLIAVIRANPHGEDYQVFDAEPDGRIDQHPKVERDLYGKDRDKIQGLYE